LGLVRQPAVLVIGESGLFAQLLLEDLHLLPKVIDDALLVSVEPASDTDQQQLKRIHRPMML
jgi:hypothetical protein